MNEDVAVTTPCGGGCIYSVSAFSAPGVVRPISRYGCTLWAKPTVAQWLLSSMVLTLPGSSCFVQKGWNSSRFKLRPTRLIGHKLLFVLRTNSRLFSSCVIRHLKGLNALWISSAWNISVHQLTKMYVCVFVCVFFGDENCGLTDDKQEVVWGFWSSWITLLSSPLCSNQESREKRGLNSSCKVTEACSSTCFCYSPP